VLRGAIRWRRGARLGLTAVGLAILVSGCSIFAPQYTLRGNRVQDYRLKELTPGTSTQADVTALIGSPTAKASFDPNTWLYISEISHTRIAQTIGEGDQQVVILSFDDKGVLTNIRKLDEANSLPVTVVARTTPSPGTEASFLQQLFGNVGRFNPLGAGGGGGGGGGSPNGIVGR
jgi:outer membrane protein assembly factor BamE (lipoprotein component of BamABCDE complex)